ncbi:MAG: hypothetical protein ACXVH7_09250 [Thermoanaerobaculia bacterium]
MSAITASVDYQFDLLAPAVPRVKPILVPDPLPLPSGERESVRRLRASLDAAIAAKVMNATELIRAVAKQSRDDITPTMLEPLDALLGGGLRRGKMTEITGRRSCGRFSIAMAALASSTSIGEAAAFIDLGDHFDPQIAESCGVDLRRVLWVRPHTMKQAVMAVEMLTATGFQLVVLDAAGHPIKGRRVHDAAWVRLARSAERHGAAMLISAPYPLTGTASEAVVNAWPVRTRWIGQHPRVLAATLINVSLQKHRHIRPGHEAVLSFRAAESAGKE